MCPPKRTVRTVFQAKEKTNHRQETIDMNQIDVIIIETKTQDKEQ